MSGIKNKVAFFDRDGILNVDTGYLSNPKDFTWIEGAPEAVAAANDAGFKIVVVTNQSGIGRGYYSEEDMHCLHAFMNDELERLTGVRIDAFYFCPYVAKATLAKYRHPDHPDRKPNPGMLLRAFSDLNIDMSRSFMVGDKQSDVEAAKRAGIRGLLYRSGSLLECIAVCL